MHSRGAQTQLSPQGRQFPTHCTQPKGTAHPHQDIILYISHSQPDNVADRSGLQPQLPLIAFHQAGWDGESHNTRYWGAAPCVSSHFDGAIAGKMGGGLLAVAELF